MRKTKNEILELQFPKSAMDNNINTKLEDKPINNNFNIQLNSEFKNNSEFKHISLNVFLIPVYQRESFKKFSVEICPIKNGNIGDLQFDLGKVINIIFSEFDKDFKSEFCLSYYLNDDDDKGMNIFDKKFYYFGDLNIENNQDENLYVKIPKDKNIYLKLRPKIKQINFFEPEIMKEKQNEYLNNDFNHINPNEEKKQEKKGSREKEKTIVEAIIKVAQFEQILQKSNSNISQDDAAKLVGIPKKTLYDYKRKIKEGRKHQFNFIENLKCRMHVLKDFIEEKRKKD